MPLAKTDYGDFSQNDLIKQIARAVQDYYMPGRYASGGGTTSAAKPQSRMTISGPPQRIDMAQIMAAGQPQSLPQPPLPRGWTSESVQAQEVPTGSPMGMPMPSPGARVPMPEMGDSRIPLPQANPVFHDASGAARSANSMPAMMGIAKLMAGRNSGAPFPQTSFNQFNPDDLRTNPIWYS